MMYYLGGYQSLNILLLWAMGTIELRVCHFLYKKGYKEKKRVIRDMEITLESKKQDEKKRNELRNELSVYA